MAQQYDKAVEALMNDPELRKQLEAEHEKDRQEDRDALKRAYSQQMKVDAELER